MSSSKTATETPRSEGRDLNPESSLDKRSLVIHLREAAKKFSSLNGRAIKRGGGGKGPAIKEKRTFKKKNLLPFKNKNYFTLDNLSEYGHITLTFVGRYFYLAVTIFSEK